jgi:hypothetical protein
LRGIDETVKLKT